MPFQASFKSCGETRISLYGLNFYIFQLILEGASDDLEEIQVIKTAFSFLFKIKLFQLLFWLDFEPVNGKKKQKRKNRKREVGKKSGCLVTWDCRIQEARVCQENNFERNWWWVRDQSLQSVSSPCCKSAGCKLVCFPVKLKKWPLIVTLDCYNCTFVPFVKS